jgi:hypothetical protein
MKLSKTAKGRGFLNATRKETRTGGTEEGPGGDRAHARAEA